MDAAGLADEAKEASEIRRSLELTSETGTNKMADGMAKTIRVGTGTKAMNIQRRKLHELDATSGAESKTVETMRTGRSPRGAKSSGDAKGSPKRDAKGSSPGKVKIVAKNQAASSDSKAYQKTMGSLSAELGGSKGEGTPLGGPSRGDEGTNPSMAEAKEGGGTLKPKPSRSLSPGRVRAGGKIGADGEKKTHMLTKAEAVALFEENRKKKMEEERAYAAAQAERFHRASVSGKNFDTMLRRAERASEKNKAKMEAKQAAEQEAEKKAAEERENARKAHLSKNLSKVGELSWAEMQEQQEIARKEAAEKRKQEIASQSKAPAGAFAKEADKKHRDAAKAAELDAANTFTFKAADPEKVTARLDKQHQAWVRTLETAKERASEKLAQAALATMGKAGKDPAAQMEARAEVLKAKRETRLSEKRERDAKINEKKLEKEKKAQERLFNEKVPETGRRLTKSAQNRAELVRKALEKEERDKLLEERRAAAKAKREREMSLILKNIVQKGDRERKEKLPGFREISDAQMKEHIKSAKQEFKTRLMENKKRLSEVINNRPSLLERHEHDIAARTAGTKALGRMANAMGSGELDLFNEDEAAKLGVLTG